MCGRYTLAAPPAELVEAFDVPDLTFAWVPRFNIAPGQEAPVVAADARGRRMGLMTWGLVPAWRDEPGSGLINARAESVHEKPSFREAFARRRCLIPADGFYEWKDRAPWWFHPTAAGVVSFAGVWERWARPGVEPRHGFAILTTSANDDVGDVHDRMPVVVPADRRALWLDRDAAPDDVRALLRPPPADTFSRRCVGRRVNRVGEDDAGLIEAVDEEEI